MVTPGDIKAGWEWIKLGGAAARYLPLGWARRAARYHATYEPLRLLHRKVIHSARDLAFAIDQSESIELEDFSRDAMAFCTACRDAMESMIRHDKYPLNCCLKLYVEPDEGEGKIATWVRSEPHDHRPIVAGFGDVHPITGNTVWASFTGTSDGKHQWQKVRCFSSNNLPKHADNGDYRCTRDNWRQYYRSTLVVPLRVTYDATNQDGHIDLGYLAFDTPIANGFPGMPDAIELRDNLSGYIHAAEKQPLFQLAAAMADLTSMFLLEPLERLRRQQEQNNLAEQDDELES